ncbi:MAG: hypothetical protein J0L96_21215 [Anaerolineae bacterium]|jgi:hypothetical protein|nr:hypothetical protein [Anaerolineae bacterium]
MKRVCFTLLTLVALLAMTTGTAFAGSAMELVEVRNDDGGPTFVFRVIGEFTRAELDAGFVSVDGGEDFPLYCAQTDEDTVVCHASRKIGSSSVVVGFGGARFWVDVPGRKLHCYGIWDWWPATNFEWTNMGSHCQEGDAQLGDQVYYNAPEYGVFDASVIFFDYDVSGNCVPPVPYDGPAYYYPNCPP